MRISPKKGSDVPGATDRSGFTLVEMLVVLAIIGVISAVVVIGMPSSGGAINVEAEAQRLARTIGAASDEALVSDRPLALAWDASSYTVLARQGDDAAPPGARHKLPDSIRLEVRGRQSPLPISPDAPTEPLSMILAGPDASWRVDYDGLNVVAVPQAEAARD